MTRTLHQITVEKACRYIEACSKTPSLAAVARHTGYSPAHFQRIFTEALGISPRLFAEAAREKRLRTALSSGDPVTKALYDAGYNSSSRVYEFAARFLGMAPAAYGRGGRNQTVWFTIVDCPLGKMLIAATLKGICAVAIEDKPGKLKTFLKETFHSAVLIESEQALKIWTQMLVDYLAGKAPWPELPYDIQATAFQKKVWDWLRTIPPGKTYYYEEAARAIGKPKAARAVARACASNPAALIIPCHRIVPKSGGVGGYRWQPNRKQKLLELEKGQSAAARKSTTARAAASRS